MSKSDFVRKATILDVPVYYDRLDHMTYGTPASLTDVYGMPALHDALSKAFSKIIEKAGRGLPKAILTAGAYVDKPGWHSRGLAFDLDGIIWPKYTITMKQFPQEWRNYLIIDACLRSFFPTVLDFFYNKAHQDHFHVQLDGSSMGFNQHSTSDTKYVQATLNHVVGEQLRIDGIYGDKTMDALLSFCDQVGIDRDITTPQGYYLFNEWIIDTIIAKAPFEADKVYDVALEMQQLLGLIDKLGPLCDQIAEKREFLEGLLIDKVKG